MKNLILSVVGSVIASVAACAFFFGGASFGAVSSPATNLDYLQLSQGLELPAGPSVSTAVQGTNVQGMFHGSCNIGTGAGSATLAAFETRAVACAAGTAGATAIPGIVAGDRVFLSAPTTTPAAQSTIVVNGVAASTTAGFISVELTNASSSSIVLTSAATSSWNYWIIR